MAADPEIVIIGVGMRPPLRREMVLAALAHGKHVYSGIPFTKSLEDARAIVQAWRRAGSAVFSQGRWASS